MFLPNVRINFGKIIFTLQSKLTNISIRKNNPVRHVKSILPKLIWILENNIQNNVVIINLHMKCERKLNSFMDARANFVRHLKICCFRPFFTFQIINQKTCNLRILLDTFYPVPLIKSNAKPKIR